MKLSEIKMHLHTVETVNFQLENGTFVPEHFHITEVGIVSKHFIDCGGKLREEKVANFQLWDANDFEHRLKPGKLQKIIALSEQILGMEDLEIEVEYQSGTIGKYNLGFDGENFILLSKHTACLAKENCGNGKQKVGLSELETSCCAPNGNCC
jgi:hypothetical protein